jgi:hypothetical protein
MVLVITAYQEGELSGIGGTPVQVMPRCMLTAFTPENVANVQKRYPKRQLSIVNIAA